VDLAFDTVNGSARPHDSRAYLTGASATRWPEQTTEDRVEDQNYVPNVDDRRSSAEIASELAFHHLLSLARGYEPFCGLFADWLRS
jgi:hypothetical protein